MKQRLRIYKESLVSPILFRSKIFSPICQDAPSFLVDIRDTASIRSIGETKGFSQKQLHVTLYHLTLRHNIDSDWIEKLQEILPQTKLTDPEHHPSIKNESPPSMTRVFVSIADCNLDYSSPTFFETESRSIVRLGDLRFSSNIMIPANRNQAYSISLGDLSYHISNQRISHSEEDSKLCCAPIIMPTNPGRSRRCQSVSMHGTTAEAVLREMGFVDILGLDSVDAVIAVTDWSCPGQKREPGKDPRITTSLTFGLLSVNACKDSFNCFAATVGELQAKLTALTDEDLSRVRGATVRRNQERTTSPAVPTVQPSMQRVSGLDSEQKGNSDAFLLDGYDWTEIDHDPLREWEIPDGDEQVAGWYNSLLEGGTCSTGLDPRVTVPDQMRGYPGRIIHHHFPFHSISNPMSEGDMGAAGHAGKGSELVLKSRVLIHKLAVKLRFYDGYDWPEKLNDREKKLLRRNGTFVIEPLPRDEAVKAKEALASEVASKFEDEDLTHMKRKVAIMADLLSSVQDVEEKSPFDETPLPEDRAKVIEQKAEMRRLSRKTKIYLQVSVNGVTVRIDAYEESITHRLASVIGVSVSDLFVAETASLSYPVKMLGEWVNESEHPRDTRFGTLMLKVSSAIAWRKVFISSTSALLIVF